MLNQCQLAAFGAVMSRDNGMKQQSGSRPHARPRDG